MRYMDGGRRRLEGEHPGCVAHKPPRCSAVVVARSGASLPRGGAAWGLSWSSPVGCALPQPLKACESVTLTNWYASSLPIGCVLLQPLKAYEGVTLTGWCTLLLSVDCALLKPLKACEGVTLSDWQMSSSPVGCILLQPFKACEGVTLTVRPATATAGVRGRDAHRLAHVVVAGRLRPVTATDCVRGRDAHRAPCHSH